MTSISGSATDMGIKIATTWGTAVACGAGNRFSVELTPNFNVNELVARTIGSGAFLLSDVTRGNFIPTISVVARSVTAWDSNRVSIAPAPCVSRRREG